MDIKEILPKISNSVKLSFPEAKVILYGSQARGDHNKDSDLDVLILLNQRKVTREDEKRVKYPLYDIEFETGIIISAVVLSRYEWEAKHRITPFYENISREGIVL
jgi:predicted nucleotidyltransferase